MPTNAHLNVEVRNKRKKARHYPLLVENLALNLWSGQVFLRSRKVKDEAQKVETNHMPKGVCTAQDLFYEDRGGEEWIRCQNV